MAAERPSAQPVDANAPTSSCFHCGQRTRGTLHEDYVERAGSFGYGRWTKCRNAHLKEYQLGIPSPGLFTDPLYQHPQLERHLFERGPDWLGDEAPRRWGAALAWWKPTKEWAAVFYEDNRVAHTTRDPSKKYVLDWFKHRVKLAREEDDRFRPTHSELDEMPWNTSDEEDPPQMLR